MHISKKIERRYKSSRRIKIKEARNGHQQEKKSKNENTDMLLIPIAFSPLSFLADYIKVEVR